MNDHFSLYGALLQEQSTGQQICLDRSVFAIGRSPFNDLVLAGNCVSRHHAMILRVDDHFYIEDLNSKNGTLLNGIAIRERTMLRCGDLVQIGTSCLAFIHPGVVQGYMPLTPPEARCPLS